MKKLFLLVCAVLVAVVMTSCSGKIAPTAFVSDQAGATILIAGDASEFKDAIRNRIITAYRPLATIRVVNMGDLNTADVGSVDAVVIMDSCLAWTGLNPSMKSFMERPENRKKTVLFMTARDPDWTYSYQEVDAITSASDLEKEEQVFTRIAAELDRILNS